MSVVDIDYEHFYQFSFYIFAYIDIIVDVFLTRLIILSTCLSLASLSPTWILLYQWFEQVDMFIIYTH